MIVTAFQTYRRQESKWIGQFVDRLPVGVARTTPEGRIVFVNRQFAAMFGYDTARELRRLHVGVLYRNLRDRGQFVKAITRKGGVDDFILPLKKRDGSPIWVGITARVVYDEDRMPQYFDCALRDVTAELERFPGPHRKIGTRTGGNYACRLDPQGRLVGIDQATSDLLGIIGKELIGRRLPEMIAPSYRELFTHFLDDIEEKGVKEGVLTIADEHGTEHHLEFAARVVQDPLRGRQIHCNAKNVTEQIKLERQAQATEKFRGVLEMAGGVSHRLNQPLTIVSNLIRELLDDLPPGESSHRKVVRINHQVEQLVHLAKKISGIRKYEAVDYVAGVRIVDIDKAS